MSTARCLRSYLGLGRQFQISNAPRSYLFLQTRPYATSEADLKDNSVSIPKPNATAETPQAPEPQLNQDASRTGEGLAALDSLLESNSGTATEKTGVVNTRSASIRTTGSEPSSPDQLDYTKSEMRMPLNVAAVYLSPLRRKRPQDAPTTCQVQMRSYSVRNLELMADFAMRAAFYLGLSASGPVPLPKRVERWTVLKSNFIHKKSQENFERTTRRRLIDIKGGHPEVVQTWLAYLRKHAYHGVGMKANVWENEGLNVGQAMDSAANKLEESLQEKLSLFGSKATTPETSTFGKIRILNEGSPRERFKDPRSSQNQSKQSASEAA